MKSEYILFASIHFDNGKSYLFQPSNIKTGIVLNGHRHGCIFQQWAFFNTDVLKLDVAGRQNIGFYEKEQGFLTNANRFVDRKEAAKIAFAAGQIQKEIQTLYSEDLY